jgi:L-iditol 2-dehydrogenase
LLLVQLLRGVGAGRIVAVEPLEHRRDAALRSGADEALAPTDVRADQLDEVLGPLGVDAAFEVAGTDEAVGTAIRAVRPAGRVILVGIPGDDQTTFCASAARRKGLTLLMSRRMGDVYPRAIDLVARGVVDARSLVSQHYGLTRVADAFGVAASRAGLKVMVRPWDA